MSKTGKMILIMACVVLVAGAAIYYFMFYKKAVAVTPATTPDVNPPTRANSSLGKVDMAMFTPASVQAGVGKDFSASVQNGTTGADITPPASIQNQGLQGLTYVPSSQLQVPTRNR